MTAGELNRTVIEIDGPVHGFLLSLDRPILNAYSRP